jgi:glycosyltransferase involved in cell wall biosynthesis
VFCLPTRADCLGIAFAEAGAMGIPSVATDIGGISEIVRDGDTGLLVPVDDAGSTAEAIERLAVDGRLRGRLGDRAHRLVVQTFNASTNADRLIDLLMDVAGKAEPDDARAGFTAPG